MSQDQRSARDIAVARWATVLSIIGLWLVLISTPWFRVQPQDYPVAELAEAKQYIDSLASDTRIPQFPDNQPVSRLMTSEPLGDQAAKDLKMARPTLFRPAWGLADIEIVVISNFLRMSATERRHALANYSLRGATRKILMDAQPVDNGCAIYTYTQSGWSDGGFVLVDPAAPSMTPADVTSCVIAGFDHLLGVPVRDGSLDFRSFPKPGVSGVLLDYVRHCAEIGETTVSPKQTANTGITNFPSVQCISREIGEAINRSSAHGT